MHTLIRGESRQWYIDPTTASADIYRASEMKYSAHITQPAFPN